jgi:hypothetical protein
MLPDDLHSACTLRRTFCFGVDGRGARRSTIFRVSVTFSRWFLRSHGIAAAHEIAAFAADAFDIDVGLWLGRDELEAIFKMLVLKAPAKPLSPVTTINKMVFSGRSASRG